jgi:DNA topoisomerase-2
MAKKKKESAERQDERIISDSFSNKVDVSEFFHNDYKQYSIYDNVRSIPLLVDGFKPSQRKVIHTLIKRGENAGEIKVEQLANLVAYETAYNHGAANLVGVVVGLAQDYVGSNNLNLLIPSGSYGSRLNDGKAASGRYIFTYLSENFRKIFKKDDDIILNYLYDNESKIEPDYFVPILPGLLINGCEGMGVGYATYSMAYNPEEIRDFILNFLKGGKQKKDQLVPWYKGFKGKIRKTDEGQIEIEGNYEIINSTTIEITELPIGMYRDDYVDHLNKLEEKGFIKDHTDDSNKKNGLKFTIKTYRETTQLFHEELLKKLKLIKRETENFTLWDEEGKIKVFDSPEDIIYYFIVFRLQKYEQRRRMLIEKLTEDLKFHNEKMRFIKYYIANSQLFSKKSKKECVEILTKEEFTYIDELLSLKIYNLTGEEIDKLKEKISEIEEKIEELKKSTPEKMYIKELEELEFSEEYQ